MHARTPERRYVLIVEEPTILRMHKRQLSRRLLLATLRRLLLAASRVHSWVHSAERTGRPCHLVLRQFRPSVGVTNTIITAIALVRSGVGLKERIGECQPRSTTQLRNHKQHQWPLPPGAALRQASRRRIKKLLRRVLAATTMKGVRKVRAKQGRNRRAVTMTSRRGRRKGNEYKL